MTFNPLEGISFLIGGMLISAAISLNHIFGKRTTDPSNSLYSMLTLDSDSKWRSSFISGMLFVASLIASRFGLDNTYIKPFESEKLFFQGTGMVHFMISGLLIGLGTRLAQAGLTKYSLYGIPKLNGQSLAATGTILGFAVITATLRSSISILQGLNLSKKFNEHLDFRLSFLIPLAILIFNLARNSKDKPMMKDILTSFGIGSLLSLGLIVSGLARRHQVLDFLSLNRHWNPFFLFVIAGVFLGNFIMLNYFRGSAVIEDSPSGNVGAKTIVGCSLFGMGLGVTGLTPGSGLLLSPVYLPQIALFFLPFVLMGQAAAGVFDSRFGNKHHVKVINAHIPAPINKTVKIN